MNDSQQILKHMCRACMCKHQTLHSLCDDSVDKSLTIYEMLAITIPQVPIHSNDELPKKICAACLNTLIIVHKFQQMCIASETYMRSLLVSNRLTSQSSISGIKEEFQNMAMAQEKVKLNIQLVMQNPNQCPRSLKVEANDEAMDNSVLEPIKYYQENDATNPEWSDSDDIRQLKKSRNTNLVQIPKEEFQDCLTFENSNVEEQECDLMTSLRNKTALLENREMHNDDRASSMLDSCNDSDTNSEWNDGDSRYQKKSTSIIKAEPQQALGGFECPKCPRRFERQNSLSSHMIIHRKNDSKSDNTDSNLEKNIGDDNAKSSSHKQYTIPCPHCDATFSADAFLKIHSHLHDKTRPFPCEVCNYRFKTKRGKLIHHKKTHKITPPGGFKCPKCPRRFGKQVSLAPHMKTHCENLSQCNLCPQKFVKLARFANHMRQHEIQKLMHENKKDNTETNLERNLGDDQCVPKDKQYDETRPFVCNVCNYSFETNTDLLHHRNTHKMTTPGDFKCPTCPRRFEKHVSVLRHMRTHRENLFKCELCPKEFTTLTGQRKHLRKHEFQKLILENGIDNTDANSERIMGDDNDKTVTEWNDSPYSKHRRKFACPDCGATFSSESKLKRHSHQHDETRPFVCEVCNYRFETSTNLLRHKITHKTTPPGGFKCPKCPRRFEKQISIVPHMRTHRENENKIDNSDSNLEENIVDDKPDDSFQYKLNFRCKQCDSAFIDNNKLQLHARVHIETHPFVCEICNYRYKNRCLLARHITITHNSNESAPVEGYKCPLCSKRFLKMVSLKLHVAVIHKKTDTS